MENDIINRQDFLAEKRAKAIAGGNLVIAEFIASQMPAKNNLTITEVEAIRQALISQEATLKLELWTSYFQLNRETAWLDLEAKLASFLEQGQFTNVIEVLHMLRRLTQIEGRVHRYRQLVESLPKIYFQQDQSNLNFEDFMRLEIVRLNPDHQKLVRFYSKIFFYFVEQSEVPKSFVNFCKQELSIYQADSPNRLATQLLTLAQELSDLKS